MANLYWNSVTGQWNAASFGGALPADADTLYADGRVKTSFIQSLDRTGDSAGVGLKLARFETLEDFLGDLGSADSPMKFRCSTAGGIGVFIHRGRGKLYFVSASGSGSAITDQLILDTPNLSHEVVLPIQVDQYTILRGKAIWPESSVGISTPRLFVGYRNNPISDSYVTIRYRFTGLRVMQWGGTLIFEGQTAVGSTGSHTLAGGYLQLNGIAPTYIQTGGHCDFGMETIPLALAPSIGTAYLLGGSMDATKKALGQTITTAYIAPSFNLIEDSKLTITNRIKLWE